jgi:hypothetical protein
VTLFLARFSSAFRRGGPGRTPKLPGLGLISFMNSGTASAGGDSSDAAPPFLLTYSLLPASFGYPAGLIQSEQVAW